MLKTLIFCFFGLIIPSAVFALTATVTFTSPSNSDHSIVVLVSEVSGDYSHGYGQRADPGATSVKIGNIKPTTQYYFVAYQVNLDTWEKSNYSEELPFMTEAYAEQIVVDLPPLELSGVTISLTITMEETP